LAELRWPPSSAEAALIDQDAIIRVQLEQLRASEDPNLDRPRRGAGALRRLLLTLGLVEQPPTYICVKDRASGVPA
jgi:hypothetical protein